MRIPVPFLDRPIGAGDAIKATLERVGIKQKKDCGCKKRQQAANRAVQFVPRRKARVLPAPADVVAMRSQWAKMRPPAIPEGWSEICRNGSFAMFIHKGGRILIWEIRDGRYRNSWGFPGHHMRALAEQKFEKLIAS